MGRRCSSPAAKPLSYSLFLKQMRSPSVRGCHRGLWTSNIQIVYCLLTISNARPGLKETGGFSESQHLGTSSNRHCCGLHRRLFGTSLAGFANCRSRVPNAPALCHIARRWGNWLSHRHRDRRWLGVASGTGRVPAFLQVHSRHVGSGFGGSRRALGGGLCSHGSLHRRGLQCPWCCDSRLTLHRTVDDHRLGIALPLAQG